MKAMLLIDLHKIVSPDHHNEDDGQPSGAKRAQTTMKALYLEMSCFWFVKCNGLPRLMSPVLFVVRLIASLSSRRPSS